MGIGSGADLAFTDSFTAICLFAIAACSFVRTCVRLAGIDLAVLSAINQAASKTGI